MVSFRQKNGTENLRKKQILTGIANQGSSQQSPDMQVKQNSPVLEQMDLRGAVI